MGKYEDKSVKKMQLGHIPAITWNRLGMNAGTVEGDTSLNTHIETKFEALPEGVAVSELSYAEAQKWLLANAPKEEAESVVAGKFPMYHPQKFATGLGQEFDDYLKDSGEKIELFEIGDGITARDAIRWDMDFRNKNKAITGQLVHVGRNSSLTLIMSYRSDKEAEGLSAVSTKVVLEEGAKLTLVKVQLLGGGFLHMDDIGAALREDAAMQLIQLELGGKETFAGLQAELVGRNAGFDAKVGYVALEDHRVDINYNVVQRGRKTNCEMTFDGVLQDAAVKRLSDTIDFRRGSRGSVGHEKENVLLLGGDIINQSLPVILCEEEDMEGTHGATIGQLDDDMLFYMASRGIDEKTAQQIMVRARLGAVAREIPDENLKTEIHDYIEEAFRA